jgi:hypothetical protein
MSSQVVGSTSIAICGKDNLPSMFKKPIITYFNHFSSYYSDYCFIDNSLAQGGDIEIE